MMVGHESETAAADMHRIRPNGIGVGRRVFTGLEI
jgi:hypothetical protein